jgi:GGDEF domain-containing protein
MVAERLRSLIQTHFSKNFENNHAEGPSLNIGIAVYPDANSIEQLIDHAGNMLCEVKQDNHSLALKN